MRTHRVKAIRKKTRTTGWRCDRCHLTFKNMDAVRWHNVQQGCAGQPEPPKTADDREPKPAPRPNLNLARTR